MPATELHRDRRAGPDRLIVVATCAARGCGHDVPLHARDFEAAA